MTELKNRICNNYFYFSVQPDINGQFGLNFKVFLITKCKSEFFRFFKYFSCNTSPFICNISLGCFVTGGCRTEVKTNNHSDSTKLTGRSQSCCNWTFHHTPSCGPHSNMTKFTHVIYWSAHFSCLEPRTTMLNLNHMNIYQPKHVNIFPLHLVPEHSIFTFPISKKIVRHHNPVVFSQHAFK